MGKIRLLLIAAGWVAALGCSNGASGVSDGGGGTGGGDLALNLPYDLSTTIGDGGQQSGVFVASIGPIMVGAFGETTMCSIVQLTNTTAIDVVQIDTTLAPGSHHLIAYRSNATAPQAPTGCSSFDGVTKGEAPLFIAESASSTMKLPSEAAYHLPAGQFIRLEAHYVNATNAAIMGMGTIAFTAGAAGTYQPADIMMCGSVLSLMCPVGGLPAGMANVTLKPGFYGGGGGVDFTKLKVFAFTSHEHHRGTDVKVWKSTSNAANTSTPLYDNPSWDNPPLQTYSDGNLLTFNAGEGLEWQCSYDTSADTSRVCFGESGVSNEMCFIWAYYYPSVGRFVAQGDCWLN
jgi:hypothetical protein